MEEIGGGKMESGRRRVEGEGEGYENREEFGGERWNLKEQSEPLENYKCEGMTFWEFITR